MSATPACVVTTINPPTNAIRQWARRFPGNRMFVVGDLKTPKAWNYPDVNYISVAKARASKLAFARVAPVNHYARKNLGYLAAIAGNASLIYDTDDDNVPNKHWKFRQELCSVQELNTDGWCNVYHHVTRSTRIWPRGFSLEHLTADEPLPSQAKVIWRYPIQQGLADGSPDVDAIWRLTQNRPITFRRRGSFALGEKAFCPFNSQTTWWWPNAYPLLYLPVHASFRMTDIWRSFVAQRCLRAAGYQVAFHSPAEVFQARNPHQLLKDFRDEVAGYLHNEEIRLALNQLRLIPERSAMSANLLACYERLIQYGFLPEKEMLTLKAWLADIEKLIPCKH